MCIRDRYKGVRLGTNASYNVFSRSDSGNGLKAIEFSLVYEAPARGNIEAKTSRLPRF